MGYKSMKSSVIGLPHPHVKGEAHVYYHYMNMHMNHMHNGRAEVSAEQVLNSFMMAPTRMQNNMHMVMLMYGISDRVTLMGMGNYAQKEMVMKMSNMEEPEMSMQSEGPGDAKLMCHFTAYDKNMTTFIINGGLSVPLGSIDKTRVNSMTGLEERMPYPMQLGSGTLDPVFEAFYLGSTLKNTWGIGASSTLRLYDNKHSYRLGNRYDIIMGVGHNWHKFLATTIRLDLYHWRSIKGGDGQLNPMASPNHRADFSQGSRADFTVGVVLEGHKSWYKGAAVKLEYRRPFYEYLEGPQMGRDPMFMTTLQWVFGVRSI